MVLKTNEIQNNKERREKQEFINLLKRTWYDNSQIRTKEMYKEYITWLEYLLHTDNAIVLTREETKEIYEYVYKAIQYYLNQCIDKMKVDTDTIIKVSNLHFLIEFFLTEQQENGHEQFLSEFLNRLLDIGNLDSEIRHLVLVFYEKTELLYKICYDLYYFFDFKCEDQTIEAFLSKMQMKDNKKLFEIILYQINSNVISNKKEIEISIYNAKELIYGIDSGFFTYQEENAVHKHLIKLCEMTDKSKEDFFSIENPLFVLYLLYKYGHLKSLNRYYYLFTENQIERLADKERRN